MRVSSLGRPGVYLRAVLVVWAGLAGCQSDNQVSCPATLEPCPATLPVNGSPCTDRGAAVFCEYGDDPSGACNTIAQCLGGWYIVASSQSNCPTTLPSGCPASFGEAMSAGQDLCASAPNGQLNCLYPQGYCSCTAEGRTCSPPAAAGCPAARPYAGTPCSAPCTIWGSGTCDGQSMKCVCGTWQPVECYD